MAEAAKATLKEDLKEQSSTINYANEILNLLFSEDFLKMTTDRVEVMENIREKMDKVMNNLASSTEILENKKREIEETTVAQYRSLMQGTSELDPHTVKQEIDRVHKQAREIERHLKKFENEKKILEFHKKHHKLQKKIANIDFDFSSNEHHVKGYIQKQDGKLQTFEFDFGKDLPCDVADYLWDNI